MTRMTDDERRERAKAMLEFPVARMCQEIGQEHNRRLEWDAWGSEWFLVHLDGERRRVEVPEDWLVDYPEASQGYQWSLQARIRDKVRRLCRQHLSAAATGVIRLTG